MPQETLEEFDSAGDIGKPPRCLSVTASGPWGHFRRIEGNIVKQTYRVMPRTTAAGLLAAVLGIGRDEYYDLFSPENSAIAIEPIGSLRTVNMPMNTLTTADEAMQSLNSRGKVSIKLPNPTKPRQQHNYEVLVDPAYRLDVWLSDEDRFEELAGTLQAGKSHYVPSLGLSEHLATLEYHGTFEISEGPPEDVTEVESAAPNVVNDVIPETDTRCQVESSPAFMEQSEGGRKTTGFTSYVYNPDGGTLGIQHVDASVVDGRTVMFV